MFGHGTRPPHNVIILGHPGGGNDYPLLQPHGTQHPTSLRLVSETAPCWRHAAASPASGTSPPTTTRGTPARNLPGKTILWVTLVGARRPPRSPRAAGILGWHAADGGGHVAFRGLCDAVMCANGAPQTLAGLSLAPEHRCDHGAPRGTMSCGRLEFSVNGRYSASVDT